LKIPIKNAKRVFNFAAKNIKKQIMTNNESKERSRHAETVIRTHVLLSMGASFIPILLADIFAVSALQLDMIRQMCRVYDIDFKETQGKAIVSSLTTSTLARAGARSLVKLIPGIGSIIGGVTVSIFAGASTYALGEVFKKHFESGGTILDFDTERLRNVYKEKFEKGKKVAQEWKKEEQTKKEEGCEESFTVKEEAPKATSAKEEAMDDVFARLKKLAKLKEEGVISEEEFQEMKKKLIDNF
jgi:uncharacterized protein (DUF697 family)